MCKWNGQPSEEVITSDNGQNNPADSRKPGDKGR